MVTFVCPKALAKKSFSLSPPATQLLRKKSLKEGIFGLCWLVGTSELGRPRLSQIRTKPALKASNPSNPWAMFGGAAYFTLPQELRSNKDLFLAAWFGRSAENNKGSF